MQQTHINDNADTSELLVVSGERKILINDTTTDDHFTSSLVNKKLTWAVKRLSWENKRFDIVD